MRSSRIEQEEEMAHELSAVVACTLGVHDLKIQSERWLALLSRARRGRRETEDGLRVTFAGEPGVEEELRALVAVENECCSWAAWDVTPHGDTVVMSARSAGEGVAALHGMFLA
jgi:hypothetical protein